MVAVPAAWFLVVVAAIVARTASPIAPPIWIAVVETPETSPECFLLTPETAASVAGSRKAGQRIPMISTLYYQNADLQGFR